MKHNFFLVFLLSIISLNVFSQEEKISFKSGGGYYIDLMGLYDGPIMWIEGSYKLNTGFYLNVRASMASVDWEMSDGIFEGYRTISLRQMADLTFSKPIKLSGKHFFEPGVGFKLKREYTFYPDLSINDINGQSIIYTSYSTIFYEIGFTICLDYYYQFERNYLLGLRIDSNIIWAVGFEGLSISPLFGFRF